jgi:choline dehydrogenase-like flavoprotein
MHQSALLVLGGGVGSRENWFDFIVIGSGTAGSVLASRLSEDPDIKVGLVEAGGGARDPAIADPLQWPFLQGSSIDWGYRTVPQPHTAGRVHDWPRGRVIGGSTAINAMAHVRGHPADFDAWVAAGCTGWGYHDLLPYFMRSETSAHGPSELHGGDGPLHLIQPTEPHPVTRCYMAAGERAGFPAIAEHNGRSMVGPTVNTLTIRDGKRQTIADAYLTPAKGRANLTLLAEQLVEQLDFAADGRCNGVTLNRQGERRRLVAERGVILAAGAIGSACLLLRAGIGPAEDLRDIGIAVRHDLAGVGQNLHDHLLAGGNVYQARRPVPASRYQHSESLMYLPREGGDPRAAPEKVLACVVLPVVTECFERPAAGEAYTFMYGFTHPRSRGSIRLASADPRAMPLIDPNYLAEAYDREVYLEALETARQFGHSRDLDDWRDRELLPGPDCRSEKDALSFVQRAAYTHHHPVGTCRMGKQDDDAAVVGADLRVRGIDGLYVIDASIIPAITTGPVNAAIVAMAERASDLLRRRPTLKSPSVPASSASHENMVTT